MGAGDALVGREPELAAIDRFFDRVACTPCALVFEGQPGIGKTTVWRCALQRAASRPLVVLSCRPVEAEAKLAFAALADLLEPVVDGVLPKLPEPQRLALEVALMRAAPRDAPPSARGVAAAVLSALRLLAADGPVVLALDDQQWLDRPTAEALSFALRRVHDHRVGVVAATRLAGGLRTDPLALDLAFANHIERLRLDGLSAGTLHHVIRAHLGHVVHRPQLRRITEASGGNPLHAIELTRAMLDADDGAAPKDPLWLPMSGTLLGLVVQRLERLTARERETLLVTAALAMPTIDLIGLVVGAAGANASLRRASRAGLVEIHDGQVRFSHPLLASAVYSSAPPEKRREVHRRLADVVGAAEERARHLALAMDSPDDAVARALDEAAALARQRGAPDAAGDLQERAAQMTPPDDATARRLRHTRAAEHFFHAGDRPRARTLLERVLGEVAAGPDRARALHVLGKVRGQEDSFHDARGHLAEALAHANEPSQRVAIQLDLAFAIFSLGNLAEAQVHAADALVDAERIGDQGLIADALCMNVMGWFQAGQGIDHAAMGRALAMEDRTRPGLLTLRPTALAGQLALYDGRLSEADALLREIADWATQRGEETDLPLLLVHLAALEWYRGDLAASIRYADEAIALSVQSGNDGMCGVGLAHRANALACLGAVDEARAVFAESRRLIAQSGYLYGELARRANEGLLELALGDSAAAERVLAPFVPMLGTAEPFSLTSDATEAMVVLGQLDRAAELLEPYARDAERRGRGWVLARALRSRSLLAAARGNLDGALADVGRAVTKVRELGMPIELGRTLTVLGQVHRRRGERRAARDALDEALTLFRRCDARLWEARAAEELGRIPLRRGASKGLTPTEEQVATLAASGRTNREIAAALFMTRKTVEVNLTRIYGKLAIRSRAELGVAMLERRNTTSPAKK